MASRSNKVYIVTTRISGSELKVSQEGYDSYEKAVAFIQSRFGEVVKITDFHYRVPSHGDLWCDMSRDYFIHEVIIK